MKRITLFTLILFIASAHSPCCGQDKQIPKDSSKNADEQSRQIATTFELLNKAVRSNELDAAFDLMTPGAVDQFVADSLLMGRELASELSGEASFEQLKTALENHDLDKVQLPEAFVDPGEGGDWPDPDTVQKARKAVLHAVPQDERLAIVTEIRKAFDGVVFGLNPFDGSIIETTVSGDTAILKVEFSVEDFDLSDAEIEASGVEPNGLEMGEMEMGEVFIPPAFLTFEKAGGNWKWSGYDEKLTADALKDFELSMGGPGFGKPESLPLIDKLELSGSDVDGEDVNLEDYRGNVVLVDFWGTWCRPCVEELPTLKLIYDALHDEGLEIVGVAVDEATTLQEFYEKTSLPWKNIVDSKGKLADKFQINAFPTTLIVDKSGKHVKSDLFGVALLDDLIQRLELDSGDYAGLRKKTGCSQPESC